MINRNLGKMLSLVFVSICLCLGIGIGSAIRLGRTQASDTAPGDSLPILPPVTEEQIFPDSITIQAVGDIIPGTNYPDKRLPRDRNQLLPNSVRRHLQKADILFGNFETSLTNYPSTSKDISNGQVFAFRSPPTYAKLFADVGFDVLNVANNHSLDFGTVGFKDTIKNLKAVGIETLGHKNQILFLEANNIPVAMIGFAPYDFYNSINDIQTAKRLVKEARKNSSIVIISMHAGAEGTDALNVKNNTEFFYGENRGNSIKFARTMIDAGADLVLGHGPHVPRAMEMYKGKLIAYSLGNFLGYRTLSTAAETGYSMILEVKLNLSGNLESGKIIPVRMDRQGIPHIDQRFRTVGLVRNLNNNPHLIDAVKINRKGQIVVGNSK
ncbi:MAG: CapA family protein [Cyanomargarita calcarea GSE-NOS-MK-12-04C]|jgi:poly-gamma-glutamate capsule biosynthesis protein CapA/YwtB (metallophosphatase superfamily)|uniref:CapA family protein n=1 Tax=Cyanomargarita calcarea GSE-NOS-MK-12-04C TaxID=2839659 RepID=A0A951UV19_9CYAN|nr:CapA family protein [Cyanomargarita calcarea GSE-NOS-MK-12-04C]